LPLSPLSVELIGLSMKLLKRNSPLSVELIGLSMKLLKRSDSILLQPSFK
jgi:hypothetical protein